MLITHSYSHSDSSTRLSVCDMCPLGRECERFGRMCAGSLDRLFLGHLCTIRPENSTSSVAHTGTGTRDVSQVPKCTPLGWPTQPALRGPPVRTADGDHWHTYQHTQKQCSNTMATVHASAHTCYTCWVRWSRVLVCWCGGASACSRTCAALGSGPPAAGQRSAAKQSTAG